jgi:probable F420-dependent oxidoreductase
MAVDNDFRWWRNWARTRRHSTLIGEDPRRQLVDIGREECFKPERHQRREGTEREFYMRFSIATFVTDRGIAPAPLAKAVEDRGFHSLFVAEHSHIPLAFEEPYPGAGELPRELLRTLDPFVTLTSAAAATHSLMLATGVVLLAQRDLIYTAKEVATLDLISDGRVILGVGVGWNRHEMRNHRLDPRTRGAKVNEQIRALKQLWENDTAEFQGDFVDFTSLAFWPKPVQRPHPPIYVGGASRAALERVQSLGDGWLPLGGVAPEKIMRARRWLADNGRPDVPITICGAAADKGTLSAYADVGVDEVALQLPTLSESASLRQLDELASVAQSFVAPRR